MFADGTAIRYVGIDTDLTAKRVIWSRPVDMDSEAFPVLRQLLRRGGVFVDVGAYSGLWSLYACRSTPGMTAIAFEPNPLSAANMLRNVMANRMSDRIRVVTSAVGDRPGPAVLRIPVDNSRAALTETSGFGVGVQVVTLDDEVREVTAVSVVKIDVEGIESAVIDGAHDLLARTGRPPLIVEVLDSAAFVAVRAAVEEIGYRHAYHLRPAGPVEVTEFAGRVNYLFTWAPLPG